MDNISIYDSIMDIVEKQKKDEKLNTKLYRYTGLIKAIEYFSQRLNQEQIIDAAFDFINELLTLEKSAIFIIKSNSCYLQKHKGYSDDMSVTADTVNLQSLARMHGAILYDRSSLAKYFDSTTIDKYGVTALTPLIIDGSLYAFILMSRKTAGVLDDDDYIISEALMRLINNSLNNFKSYGDLQNSNRELDEKIFNLFAINQSSKVLLSELDLDALYKLSVDVFSELTQSSFTGFVLHDGKTGKYTLKAYKDVYFSKEPVNIKLTPAEEAALDINKIIINVSDDTDREYFNSIFFEGIDALLPLKALFVVLLIKNGQILGFVTLGKTTTGNSHNTSDFELIESLASSTYIAISNAQYIKQIADQKKMIQGKLKKLISLNKLIKNINSALKTETLMELTLRTLEEAFDVRMGMMALYNHEKQEFNLSNELKTETGIKTIKPNKNWSRIFKGKVICINRWQAIGRYFDKDFCESLAPGDGILLAPIYVERVGVELLGVIIIFKYGKTSIDDEENLLTLETIANHIAPVMSNLITMEEQKRFSLPNYIELFKRDLKNEINEAVMLSQKLQVVRININRDFTFKNDALHEKLVSNYEKVYSITSNIIFIILGKNDRIGDPNLHRLIGKEDVQVSYYNLGKEFTTYQDFFNLF
jgi:hypothetical protein